MPKKPTPKAPASSPSAKKKPAFAPDILLNEDDIAPEDLKDEEEDEKDNKDDAALPSVEEEVDKTEEEEKEEEVENEEEILAKGDELEILNLLAKKANRMEKGLDDDETVPDEEGMGGF